MIFLYKVEKGIGEFMRKQWYKMLPIVGALLYPVPNSVMAKVPKGEAQKLGEELTPYGGLVKGESVKVQDVLGKGMMLDIPIWDGGLQKKDWPEGYKKPGQHHPNPYESDKILFTVTAANAAQFSDILTDGHKSLLKTYPDTFSMPVYTSRRSHSAPQWVYDNIANNAVNAELLSDHTGVLNAYGGVAFPIIEQGTEKAAVQALWNHITRFRGSYVLREASEVAVHQNGDYQLVSSVQEVHFNYYDASGTVDTLNNVLFYYLSQTHAPARLAGSSTLVHEPLNQTEQARQAWKYNAGQRRVRRAPSLAFDAPIAAADGLRTADDTDIFNGSPERYDWKLIGLQNKLIPYNNYKLDDPSLQYKTILESGHIKSDLARYELHRVWIVEGTLKSGSRHIYGKRRFYIDEDSWSIAVADQYDVRGNLWRVSVAYLKNYYDVPTTWSALDVFHDLQAKRYHVQFLDNESENTLVFASQPPNPKIFTPQFLRRMGRR